MNEKHRSDITKIRLLRQIIEKNQEKINAIMDSGMENSQGEKIADLHNDITIARKEILDIRNERIQNLFKKKKK